MFADQPTTDLSAQPPENSSAPEFAAPDSISPDSIAPDSNALTAPAERPLPDPAPLPIIPTQVSVVPFPDALSQESLSLELDSLTPPEATAMDVLLRGGTITAAARAANISRKTLYTWLKPTSEFGQIYHHWKLGINETSRNRLLMLAESATNQVATAIKRGDTKTALKLLTGMGILSSPPVGLPLTQHKADMAHRENARSAKRFADDARRDGSYNKYG